MFSKPGKTKKLPRPGISLIICCHIVSFSSPLIMPGKEGTRLCQGTWADPLRIKMMVNHVPFMHSYFGFGAWVFFSKASTQHTISLNNSAAQSSKRFSRLFPQHQFLLSFGGSFFFFFHVLGKNISHGDSGSSLLSFLGSSLPLHTDKFGICLEPYNSFWLSAISACFLQGGPWFDNKKSVPRQSLAELALPILPLYRSYSCIS